MKSTRNPSIHSASQGPQDQIHNMKGCSQRRERQGFWFALTCVCSLYMLLKTLLIFHNSK